MVYLSQKNATQRNFNEALIDHNVEENLLFTYAGSKSLRRLLIVCNPQEDNLLIGADSSAGKIGQKYFTTTERVKTVLTNINCSR